MDKKVEQGGHVPPNSRRISDPEVIRVLKPLVLENNARARDRMYAARDTEPKATDKAEEALIFEREQQNERYQKRLAKNELRQLRVANWELGQEGKDAAIAHIEARKSAEEVVRSKGVISRVRRFLKAVLNR